jgi:hypothetical protein
MCVTEIYFDRYPDGSQVEYRQIRHCQYGRPSRPCEMHSTLENTPRLIGWGEPTSEFILTQLNTPPRSSASSGRPSIEIIREESPRPRRRRRPGLLMSAFFGDPPRRRRRENVVVVNGPPSPRSPRAPRTPTIPPPAPAPRNWGFPSGYPSAPRTPEPFVYDASPTRGRRRIPAIIIDNTLVNGQRQQRSRAASVDVNVGGRRSSVRPRPRSRSPSPTLADLRRQDEERERERRRQRDLREAQLEAELRERRERRLRDERRALQDAEINARPPVRPAVPQAPLPLRRRAPFGMPPVVQQSQRLHEVLDDLHLSARGERVIAEAVAERRRIDAIRAGMEAEEDEARRERLRRRFTVGGGGGQSGGRRRNRVLYDDGTYRYEM